MTNGQVFSGEPEKVPNERDMFLADSRAAIHERIYKFQIALRRCQNCCALCGVLACVLLLMLSLFAVAFRPDLDVINVVMITADKEPVFVTDERFLSVTLDSSVIAEGFSGFDMKDPRLSALLSALSPGYFRVGGTAADRLYFFPDSARYTFKAFSPIDFEDKINNNDGFVYNNFLYPNFTMSGEEWLQLLTFTYQSDFRIVFDLNALIRYDNGSWDPNNAESLFRNTPNVYSVSWQLGNEPDLWREKFNYAVTPQQLAKDFHTLRTLLRNETIIGPDTTRPLKHNQKAALYLEKFAKNAFDDLDVLSFHHYYFDGQDANFSLFIDPEVFDSLQAQIHEVKQITKPIKNMTLWLTETGDAYHGGVLGCSNRYISTFIWLDKLGLAAYNGVSAVMRQSFFKGNYALIDSNYEPTPNWWISVLYKKLVGRKVIACYKMKVRRLRIYCHCTNNFGEGIPYITVFGMNMQDHEAKLRIELANVTRVKQPTHVYAYVLTSDYSLFSKHIQLNGQVLLLGKNGSLPEMKPVIVKADPYLLLPPFSLGFWVFPTKIDACVKC